MSRFALPFVQEDTVASNIREFQREVSELIDRWEIGGRMQAPGELCADRPDLESEVASQIRAIRSLER